MTAINSINETISTSSKLPDQLKITFDRSSMWIAEQQLGISAAENFLKQGGTKAKDYLASAENAREFQEEILFHSLPDSLFKGTSLT